MTMLLLFSKDATIDRDRPDRPHLHISDAITTNAIPVSGIPGLDNSYIQTLKKKRSKVHFISSSHRIGVLLVT